MDKITTTTNSATGVITRITVIQHNNFDYRWLLLALAATALIAWGLRKIFWTRNSN